ncbi:tRNA pseudouridine(55) synthase TruB [Angustibacter peucedani]
MTPRPDGPDGLVVVDKPGGWTSHDVVARVRRLAGTRKVGHAGTLDPMATGVLVVGVERATKLLTYLVGADKTYTATVRLGAATVTDDAEGEVTARADGAAVVRLSDDDGRADVDAAVRALTGPIEQVPSAVSAIKVDGQRSYARVRGGEQVDLPARPVTVRRFDVLDRRPGSDDGHDVLDLDVEVEVTSGTYVRALARDLGAALGVGGHLVALRRTAVGPYRLDVARTLDELAEDFAVLPLADAARAAFTARELTEAEVTALRYGQRVDPTGSPAHPVAGFAPDGSLVALLEDRGPVARSLLVVPPRG